MTTLNNKTLYAEPLTESEYNEHVCNCDGEAALYVGTYGKYNAGSIDGAWVNIESFDDKEEFFDFCRRLHADEHDPEFMYQDFEGFPKSWYSESCMGDKIDRIIEWAQLDEDEKEIIEEYWDEAGGDEDEEFQDILDKCVYHGDNCNDYYDELADLCFEDNKAWEKMQCYFDWEKWRRDCSYDYTETSNCIFQI